MDDESHPTTRTKRLRVEAKSQEIAKRVKGTDWEDYDVDFEVPGTGGAHDVLRFLK